MSDIPKILPDKTIDKAYDDLLHPVASEIGKAIGRIPKLINSAFAPLDIWIENRNFNVAKTKQLLEKNLENADPDKIVPPEPYVAVPAIESISYCMNSDELRTLYANLLTKSIYADTKDSVHPAFTEIIRNLSPLDCKVFNYIMNTDIKAIGCYELRVGTIGAHSFHVIFPCVTEITLDSPIKISASLGNLSRNSLISYQDFHYDDDSRYKKIRETAFFKQISQCYSSNPNNQELRPYKMSVQSTDWGREFYEICSIPL